MEKKKVVEMNGTMKSRLEYAAFLKQGVSREEIDAGISRELRDAYLLLSEILSNRELKTLIVDWYYAKYEKLRQDAENNPELPLAQNDVGAKEQVDVR